MQLLNGLGVQRALEKMRRDRMRSVWQITGLAILSARAVSFTSPAQVVLVNVMAIRAADLVEKAGGTWLRLPARALLGGVARVHMSA